MKLLTILTFFSVTHFSIAQSADEREVLKAEKTRFRAMVEKDYQTLEKVIHERLYYTHSNGSFDTKESFIAAIRDGK